VAAGVVIGLLLSAWAARAETPSVWMGQLSLMPYVLLQLDEGGTFNQSRRGGQGTGFKTRRARVGDQGAYGNQFEFDIIYDSSSTPGSLS